MTLVHLKTIVEVRLVDAPPMWMSTCCGHCFHGPPIVRTVQNGSTSVDSSPLWTLFARPSSVHIRGPSLYTLSNGLSAKNGGAKSRILLAPHFEYPLFHGRETVKENFMSPKITGGNGLNTGVTGD